MSQLFTVPEDDQFVSPQAARVRIDPGSLEQRLAQTQAALEQRQERVREIDAQQAALRERKRLLDERRKALAAQQQQQQQHQHQRRLGGSARASARAAEQAAVQSAIWAAAASKSAARVAALKVASSQASAAQLARAKAARIQWHKGASKATAAATVMDAVRASGRGRARVHMEPHDPLSLPRIKDRIADIDREMGLDKGAHGARGNQPLVARPPKTPRYAPPPFTPREHRRRRLPAQSMPVGNEAEDNEAEEATAEEAANAHAVPPPPTFLDGDGQHSYTRNTAHRHYRALLRSERQRERAIRARALDLEATLADFAGSPDLADLASSHLADLAGGAGFSQEELMALVAGMLSAGDAEETPGAAAELAAELAAAAATAAAEREREGRGLVRQLIEERTSPRKQQFGSKESSAMAEDGREAGEQHPTSLAIVWNGMEAEEGREEEGDAWGYPSGEWDEYTAALATISSRRMKLQVIARSGIDWVAQPPPRSGRHTSKELYYLRKAAMREPGQWDALRQGAVVSATVRRATGMGAVSDAVIVDNNGAWC